jgi:two-component SAPR family response regulator
MPELGGVACARKMLAINPEVRIIFATGYDREKSLDTRDGLELIPVLGKPYKISELNDTIRLLLE